MLTSPGQAVQRSVRIRAGLVLLTACLVSVLLILPYQLTLVPLPANLPIAFPLLIVIALVQSGILCAGLIAIGLWLGPKIGLGFPALEAWIMGERPVVAWRLAAGLGTIASIVLTAVLIPMQRFLPAPLMTLTQPNWWQGLLASAYGSITEEVLLRLGVMTVIAFVVSRIWHTTAGRPTNGGMWLSVIAAAILFGIGHLPTVSRIYPLTPFVIGYIILGNSTLGIVFGWLYWRRGLAAAMLAHLCADLILHVVTPLVVGLLQH